MTFFATAPANACAAYTNLRNATKGRPLAGREHCDDLWRDFQPHADANFAAEFPIQLHERWFEMYLTVALLRAVRCDLVRSQDRMCLWRLRAARACGSRRHVQRPERRVCLTRAPPQYAQPGQPPVVTSRPTEQLVLRIRNALSVKEAVYRKYLTTGIVAPTDVLAIAINVHAMHGLWADTGDLMMRSFYGVGDLVLTLDRDAGTIVRSHHDQFTHVAKRKTGAPVRVQPFIDGSLPHISAVIGSRADAVNFPRRLGDDLTLFPNLTANVPWPTGAIQLGEEWTFTAITDGWDGKQLVYIAAT